jgi:hypothetical protein
MESMLWGVESGAGAWSLPGAAGADSLPILASRPHLDRFLSSARALDLLRPVRNSVRRGGGAVAAALPQWGTGLPGEDRVLNQQHAHEGARAGQEHGEDSDANSGRGQDEEDAMGWGY